MSANAKPTCNGVLGSLGLWPLPATPSALAVKQRGPAAAARGEGRSCANHGACAPLLGRALRVVAPSRLVLEAERTLHCCVYAGPSCWALCSRCSRCSLCSLCSVKRPVTPHVTHQTCRWLIKVFASTRAVRAELRRRHATCHCSTPLQFASVRFRRAGSRPSATAWLHAPAQPSESGRQCDTASLGKISRPLARSLAGCSPRAIPQPPGVSSSSLCY